MIIEPMLPADWPAVEAIYAEGIATGLATFETVTPSWEEFDRRHLPVCRLVARDCAGVAAWAALTPVSVRPVYAGVAEESVYVAARARGRGAGKALLDALVAESERCGFWTLQGVILAENEASLRLHRACGFREVGRRERIGQRHGIWHDTVLLERRSRVIGI